MSISVRLEEDVTVSVQLLGKFAWFAVVNDSAVEVDGAEVRAIGQKSEGGVISSFGTVACQLLPECDVFQQQTVLTSNDGEETV